MQELKEIKRLIEKKNLTACEKFKLNLLLIKQNLKERENESYFSNSSVVRR